MAVTDSVTVRSCKVTHIYKHKLHEYIYDVFLTGNNLVTNLGGNSEFRLPNSHPQRKPERLRYCYFLSQVTVTETVKPFICLCCKISNVGWHSSLVNTAKTKIKCSSGN